MVEPGSGRSIKLTYYRGTAERALASPFGAGDHQVAQRQSVKPAAAKSSSKPRTCPQPFSAITAKLIASVYVTGRGANRSSHWRAAA